MKLVILISLSIGLTSCVVLENLCESDLFTYKNLTINGFYRARQNVTLPPIGFFLIPRSADCSPSRFSNKNVKKIVEIKEPYNQKIFEAYSDDFINHDLRSKVNLWFKDISKLRDQIYEALNEEKKMKSLVPSCVNDFLMWTQGGVRLGFHLGASRGLPEGRVVVRDFYSQHEEWNKLKYVLREIQTDERTQTMAFHLDFIEDIYEKDIVSPDSVKVVGSFTKNFLDVETTGTLSYELHLPYHNKNYNKTEPCVSSDKLAYFFQTRN